MPPPFAQLQRRIGRKVLSRKILADLPVVLVACDWLEEEGQDLGAVPFLDRRRRLDDSLGPLAKAYSGLTTRKSAGWTDSSGGTRWKSTGR
jgi:DNA ligase-1